MKEKIMIITREKLQVVSTLLFYLFAFLPLSAQTTYSLKQIIDSALQNNIAIRQAQRSIENAQEQRKEAFTKFFPNVSGTGLWFNANRGMAKMDVNPSEVIPPSMAPTLAEMFPPEALAELANPVSISMMKNGTIAGITATQPVFAGGQIVNGNRLAKIGEEAAYLQKQLSENEVEKTAEQYFWQIVSLQEKTKTLDAVEAMLADIRKDVEVAVKAGVALRNDLLQVQLRQNDVASQRLKLNNGLSIVRMLLAQYCGLSTSEFGVEAPDVNIENQQPTEIILPTNDGKAVAAPMGNEWAATTEYQLLKKQVEAANLQKKMTAGKNLPTVAVGAGYNYHNLMGNDHTFGMVFATVSIPISDWWGGSHAIKQKNIELQKAIDQQKDNAELLKIRIQNAWNSVGESYQQLQIAQRSIEQAEENLRLNRDFYKAGTSKMTDLLEAQLLYQQARDQHTDAYAELQNKLLEYRQSIGQ